MPHGPGTYGKQKGRPKKQQKKKEKEMIKLIVLSLLLNREKMTFSP